MSEMDDEEYNSLSEDFVLGPMSAVPESLKAGRSYAPVELTNGESSMRIDEFGFKFEDEAGSLNLEVLQPDPQLTLRWIAFLEFQNDSDLQWSQISDRLMDSEKLQKMLDAGIPHNMRSHLWMRLSGASERKSTSEITYKDIVKFSSNDSTIAARQIEKDLLRTLPSNVCFSSENSQGVLKLRRVLRSISYMYPDIGYCQGMGTIAACLLLVMEEEDAFWTLSSILEEYLPSSYYSASLLGVLADQKVLRELVATHLPSIDLVLTEHDIELSLITVNWFMTLFATVLPFRQLLKFWDKFLVQGSIVLFKLSLVLLNSQAENLRTRQNSGDIFSAISNLAAYPDDKVSLIKEASQTFQIDETSAELQRRKYVAQLLSEQGTLVGNPQRTSSLPKERLNRRKFKSSKSNFQNFIFGKDDENDDVRTKNIRTTEILVDLRESVLRIGRHFHTDEPSLSKVSLVPDFSFESHARDIEIFTSVSRSKQKRAKALVDFERSEEDELGFRRNDIITIISQKDEHCWVGELNGLKGWFPAKFVQLLDERSKEYVKAGDDSVSEAIADFVRGGLCPAVKQILEYGLKKPSILGTPCHPWLFIEEAAMRQVEKDFNSVYSRLVLCKTFRLDEDGKVLTPEELLYRCIQAVNITHDAVHAQMDVKLRSLICLGLNEQALHLWLEVLCSAAETVQKWYQPWSFLSSPAWIQIKCELRVLSQFSFNLNPDWELPAKSEKSQPIRDGVRDMLVKHHLFSWDL